MAETGSQFCYIIDSAGTFYRVNTENELVAVSGKEEAGVFSMPEASSRIGRGKKSRFYSTVPVVRDDREDVEIHDMEKTDWMAYLQNFAFLVSSIPAYREELVKRESETDLKISDILHYIELYEADDEKALKLVEMLRTYREERRDIKDELLRLDLFQRSLGNSGNAARAKEAARQMEKLQKRRYTPRRLSELFQNSDLRKRRDKEAREEDTVEKQETIYDGKKNDWLKFMESQVLFYQEIKQYEKNLQADIQEMDARMEKMLETMERISANAAQGYQIFKLLQDMRLQRRKKLEELEQVRCVTSGLDCNTLLAVFERNLNRMTELEPYEDSSGYPVAG